MEHPALKAFEQQQMRKEFPRFQPGDTVKVNTKVVEGEKERIQVFEGVVISRNGSGFGETFKVRKVSYGVGVERTFPIHSPRIDSIEVVRRGHVRRAKLYYLRQRVGKGTRIKARKKKMKEKYLIERPVDETLLKQVEVPEVEPGTPDAESPEVLEAQAALEQEETKEKETSEN